MRGALFAVGIAVAFGATAGLGFLAFQKLRTDGREPFAAPPAAEPGAGEASDEPPTLELREYESFRTLTEDLRDALAGDPGSVPSACWRVSGRLREQAVAYLQWVARNESSPRVRALAVLAAGVHVPDEPALLRRLEDRDPRVRRAAVLAVVHAPDGAASETLLGVTVRVGRVPASSTRIVLDSIALEETDEAVKATLERVLE